MISALNLSELALCTGGRLQGGAEMAVESVAIESVSTDSRQLRAGQLFVALNGEHFEGAEFVAQAERAGAAAAVVDRVCLVSIPQLIVEDTRLALGLIARVNRRQFHGPLIGLTGSAGKTTCKEMIAAILGHCGDVLATEGNFNNEIGVPLTLLRLAPEHRYAVVEMGASRAGDIAYLTRFAEPTIALVTNAMGVHLEGFGSVESVANTKGQLLESVALSGTAVINLDDPFYKPWCRQAGSATIISFSLNNGDADFCARDLMLKPTGQAAFTLVAPAGEIAVELALLGEHNVRNAIASAAAAFAAGAGLDAIKRGLESVVPVKGRLQPKMMGGQLVIDDSYNANPQAVKAAIDVLASFSGRRCLVLGTMGELGPRAAELHAEVVDYAKQRGIEQLLMVGEFAQQACSNFGDAYLNMDILLDRLTDDIDADVVLVKGSRSAGMERAVEALDKTHRNRSEG